MYDFRNYNTPEKWYAKVKQGWYPARIYRAQLRNSRSRYGQKYQYIKIDFEILKDVLVPAFFSYKEGKDKPDPWLGKLCWAVGLRGNYLGDREGFFRDLVGRELMIRVAHRYRKIGSSRVRRERAEDFEPLSDTFALEEESQEKDVLTEGGNDSGDYDAPPF